MMDNRFIAARPTSKPRPGGGRHADRPRAGGQRLIQGGDVQQFRLRWHQRHAGIAAVRFKPPAGSRKGRPWAALSLFGRNHDGQFSVACDCRGRPHRLALVAPGWLNGVVFVLPLLSGSTLLFQGGDLLLVVGPLLLCVEVYRATSSSTAAILNHAAVAGGVHHRADRSARNAAHGQHDLLLIVLMTRAT